MPEPRPYTVQLPEAELAELRDRLARTRWPDQPPDRAAEDWAYGTELGYLRELVAYWREGFDWRAQRRFRCCSPTAGRARSGSSTS
jgi:microsomal epoxide hydrolase